MIRNKKGYRRAILIFTAVVLVIMIACTIFTAYRKSNPTIFFIAGQEDSSYLRGLEAGLQSAEAEYGVSIRRLAGGDAQAQIGQVRLAIREKAGILLLSPADREALIPVVDEARQSGIQVVFVGSRLKQDADIPRVGTDDLLAGKKAVTALAGHLPAGGSIAVIGDADDSSVAAERISGIETACREKGFAFAGAVLGVTSREEAAAAVRQLMEERPDLSGVIALGEEQSLGAADALAEGGAVRLAGFGAAAKQAQLLREGKIQALIAQRPRQTGAAAGKAAVSLGKGARIPSFTDTGSVTLTRDNLDDRENLKLISEYKAHE